MSDLEIGHPEHLECGVCFNEVVNTTICACVNPKCTFITCIFCQEKWPNCPQCKMKLPDGKSTDEIHLVAPLILLGEVPAQHNCAKQIALSSLVFCLWWVAVMYTYMI